jgi:hypothetical protein
LVQLNLLTIDYRKNPRRKDGKEAGGRETVAAFILKNFDHGSLSERHCYRLLKEAKEDVNGLFSQIEEERKRHAEAKGLQYLPIERTDRVLYEYYSVIEYRGARERIRAASPHLDTQILQIIRDLFEDSYDDES